MVIYYCIQQKGTTQGSRVYSVEEGAELPKLRDKETKKRDMGVARIEWDQQRTLPTKR